MQYRGLGRKSVYECLNLRQFIVMTKKPKVNPNTNPISLERVQYPYPIKTRTFKGPNGELYIRCSKCCRKLPENSFSIAKYGTFNRASKCKDCQSEMSTFNLMVKTNRDIYSKPKLFSLKHHNQREIERALSSRQSPFVLETEPINPGDIEYKILIDFSTDIPEFTIRNELEGKDNRQIFVGEEIETVVGKLLKLLADSEIRLMDTSYQYEAE